MPRGDLEALYGTTEYKLLRLIAEAYRGRDMAMASAIPPGHPSHVLWMDLCRARAMHLPMPAVVNPPDLDGLELTIFVLTTDAIEPDS